MKTVFVRGSLVFLLAGAWLAGSAWAQQAFQVQLNQDGDTIADMRPVYLQFEAQPLPAISPREVARRYQRLFEQSGEPEVRIDALNRLANLEDLTASDLGYGPDEEGRVYREVLASYDAILSRGAFQGRLDELLYQMAKAHAYVGQDAKSTDRLKQLIGLYPNSPLVTEARFRVAESAFAAAEYPEAESMYQSVVSATGTETERDLQIKARYMLGWSQYKQGKFRRASETFLAVLEEQRAVTDDFRRIPSAAVDLIDDTFRVIALIAFRQGGVDFLADLIPDKPAPSYSHLVYDRLADLHVSRGHSRQGVAVTRGFIQRAPEHSSVPAMHAQIVDVLIAAGDQSGARRAREQYVEGYTAEEAYLGLSSEGQKRWLDYSRHLADSYYHQASASADSAASRSAFVRSARYYAGLVPRLHTPGPVLRLVGDAWLQAGRSGAALEAFKRAAYETEAYEGAADAAWAELQIRTQALDGELSLVSTLADLALTVERFTNRFPADPRGSGLLADLANRMRAQGRAPEAERYANLALGHDAVTPSEQLAAWLVLGRVFAQGEQHRAAENAWRKALGLAESEAVRHITASEREDIRRQLGTSIYRQAERAEQRGETEIAVAHYRRIESIAGGTELAIRARFDAANCLLKAQRWQPAINELKRFRSELSDHPLSERISDKLVYAYTRSDQPQRAAEELIARADQSDDPWAARLQAAELYHQAGNVVARNRLYRAYLDPVKPAVDADAHQNHQRMRQRLIESGEDPNPLRRSLVEAELDSPWHSEETLAWAAAAAMTLATQAEQRFVGIPLDHPLPRSLSRKQSALEEALAFYERAERLGDRGVGSHSLFRRAELYRTLAQHLMASSRPGGLTPLESAQYDLLLEEQAYPFEELAIELHARNHRQLEDGHYDRWVEQSLDALAQLFPGRYARQMRRMNWQQEEQDGAS
ncbi:MAG: hypothetical protein R3175_02525 [Marinobacter sp.]|uniref:tetratricopeptide repeat protein n=1 Tax=Marinobacter sp. TaxID=50741 RepID=UPI00299EDE18|nr:tetratricopeptide repeat protein [Marinobacter sp.]MDX1754912.1 hypothetical protein [Marinobacter sp.]